jgi:hypothetical protein
MADPEVDALGACEAMATAYVTDEGNAYNSLYERPAMVELLGDVRGLRVLDAGCGAFDVVAASLVVRRCSAHQVALLDRDLAGELGEAVEGLGLVG